MRKKNKLGRQKKFLMLTSILSIILLMSTSMAAAAISRSVADSIASESAESSDVSASLASDSAETADDLAAPSVDLSSDSAVSDDNVESSPSLSVSSAESNPSHLPNKAPIADFSFEKEPGVRYGYIFDGSASDDPDGIIVAYRWSYTAGSSFPILIGDESICKHAFDKPGNYLVSLKVTDNRGASDIMNKLVMIPMSPSVTNLSFEEAEFQPPNRAPVAIFSFTPTNPKVDGNILFDATASYDPDGEIVRYCWWYTVLEIPGAWFDIVWGNVPVINYSFDEAGTYGIILCVVDNDGEMGYANQTIVIANVTSAQSVIVKEAGYLDEESNPLNRPPDAVFSYTPNEPKVDENILFDATNSYDPDGRIVEYWWFWIDYELGAWYHMSWELIPKINYSFNASGSYDVLLIVIDNDDAEGSTINTVVIAEDVSVPTIIDEENQSPVADFTWSPNPPAPEDIILFDGTSSYDTDGEIVAYWWWYDDPMLNASILMSTEPIFSYLFDEPGPYDVSLNVVDNDGASNTITKTILFVDVPVVEIESQDSQQLPPISTIIPSQKLLNIMNLGT